MKKPTLRLLLILIPIVAIAAYFLLRKPASKSNQENVIVKVVEAPLLVTIHAPGELQARKSEKIKGPDGLRTVGIYQVNIQNLVPEGTVVQEGQFVASLDRTELDSKIKDAQTEMEPEDVDALPHHEIIRAVDRNYDGGIRQFMRDGIHT